MATLMPGMSFMSWITLRILTASLSWDWGLSGEFSREQRAQLMQLFLGVRLNHCQALEKQYRSSH